MTSCGKRVTPAHFANGTICLAFESSPHWWWRCLNPFRRPRGGNVAHGNAARPTTAWAAGRTANELALRCHRLWGCGNSESFVGRHNTAEFSHHLDCQSLLIRRWTGNGVASF